MPVNDYWKVFHEAMQKFTEPGPLLPLSMMPMPTLKQLSADPQPVEITLKAAKKDKRGLLIGWFNECRSSGASWKTTLCGIILLPSGEVVTLSLFDFKIIGAEQMFQSFCFGPDSAET